MKKYIPHTIFLILIFMTTNLFAMDVARTVGRSDAPVVIEEFSSLTCPHCANFHMKMYPALKKSYIDTGKVRLVYRNYPLDNVALMATMLALSIPKEQFFPFIGHVYFYQSKLQTESEKTLKLWSKKLHLSFDKVVNNTALLKAISEDKKQAEKTKNIQGTPTIIISGEQYTGPMTRKDFFAKIDSIYAKSMQK